MERERKTIVQTVANVGCVLGLVLGLALIVIVSLRSGAVKVTLDRKTPELERVQTALRKRFRAPELTVRARDEDGPTLVIAVVNAPFLAELELETPAAADAARHAAGHARDELPPDAHYPHYEVLLEQRVGGTLALVRGHTYRFAAADLPPR